MNRRTFLRLSSVVGGSLFFSQMSLAQGNKNQALNAEDNLKEAMRLSKAPLPSTPIWQWSAYDVARGIQHKKITSLEATQSVLNRIEKENKKINAVSIVMREKALKAARKADVAIASGQVLSAMHGVPVTIKNNTDVVGEPNSDGMVSMKDFIAKSNSPLVQFLIDDGAVIVGLSNVPDFTARWFTENDLFGRTLNPWHSKITCGGASGGAAAAVATGMGAMAQGNDLGGSIRYPAYACGVVGLRPTPGRVPTANPSSTQGRTFASQFLSVQGPIARTVLDTEIAFRSMAKASPLDPNSINMPFSYPDSAPVKKVAIVTDLDGVPVQDHIKENIRKVGAMLSKEGYEVETITLPDFPLAMETWERIVLNEMNEMLHDSIEKLGSEKTRISALEMLNAMPKTDMHQYMLAIATRNTLRVRYKQLFEKYPAIILPVSGESPFKWDADQKSTAQIRHILSVQGPLNATSMLGFPSLAVPTGIASEIPKGVQIMADSFREDICFQIGGAIEKNIKPRFVFS